MVSPKLEMQRTAGKLAFFLTGVYLLVVFGLAVSTATGNPIPPIGWPMVFVPATAFVYSLIHAVKLHRTTDTAETTKLWRRSLLYAVIGMALTVAAVLTINRITPV